MNKKKLVTRLLLIMIIYIANFVFAKGVVQKMFESLKGESYKIVSLEIGAAFFAVALLALYFLFLQTIPYFIYLYFKHSDIFYSEEKEIIRWTLLTIPMGIVGSTFSFTIVKDMIIPFFLAFSSFLGVEEYIGIIQIINLTITMAVTFFIIFQLPLIIKFLTSIRIISKDNLKMKSVRLSMLLIISVVAAWITPSDIVSMLLVAVPIYTTYEIGIMISSDNSNFVECSLDEIITY